MHVATLQLGEGIYQGERKLYLHFVCSLLISEGTQKVLKWQKLCIDSIKNFNNASKVLLGAVKNQGASPPVSKAVPVNAGADVKCFAIITPNWPNCYVSECLRI